MVWELPPGCAPVPDRKLGEFDFSKSPEWRATEEPSEEWLREQAILNKGRYAQPSRKSKKSSSINVHPDMTHDEIVRTVNMLSLQELTKDNYSDVYRKASDFFYPEGSRFIFFKREGYSHFQAGCSLDYMKNWKGQPQWKTVGEIELTDINTNKDGKIWVKFVDDGSIIGLDVDSDEKFAFVVDKAFYEVSGFHNTIPEFPFPFEFLYVKL